VSTTNKALFEYNEFSQRWMKQFKFQGNVKIGESMKEGIIEITKPYLKNYIVVPIPSSPISLKKRGFNQIEVLLDYANISYINALIHNGNSKQQATKSRKERLETKQPFRMKIDKEMKIMDKNILLFDDVYTTGQTLYHAKECLFKSGARMVESVTIFR